MTIAYEARGLGTSPCYPAGFDGGNTDTCFATFIEGQEHITVLPSAIALGSVARLDLLRSGVHGVPTAHERYHQDVLVSYQGVDYFVGYMAMRHQKLATTQRGDETRYASRDQLLRLLAASGLTIPTTAYTLELVTTLPVGYYTRQLRRQVRACLEGEHVFQLNGQQRRATIRVRKILVEGPPALVLYGADSARQQRLLIDGGGYTTEFVVLDGFEPLPELCRGVELGVEQIGEYLAEQVQERYQRKLSVRERSDILRAYGSQRSGHPEAYPTIACGRTSIAAAELASIVREGCLKVGELTLKEAASLWGITNEVVAGHIPYHYHVGGSVWFYHDVLRSKMPHLRAVEQAELVNARGSMRIAQALCS
jgi:hypothetical protein